MPRGSLPTFLHPPVPPQPLMETELFVNHRHYPCKPAQRSAVMVLNQRQQGLKGWPTPLAWFRLQNKDAYTNAQVPIQNTFKLIAADPSGDCMVLAQGPSFCKLKPNFCMEGVHPSFKKQMLTGCRQLRVPLHYTLPELISSDSIPA